ncbi:aldo/keto reductase [Streptomyces sp. NPDC101165]|uniref:aldo/keto reductase n=1 Tax=Streptomyces sp. NPDC101165 TaxID=3366119 RepID=UPI003802019C
MSHFPRFQDGNREHNQALVAPLQEIADAHGASLAQLAIAWVAAQGEDIVPVVGARRTPQVESLVGSADVRLTSEDLARIEQLVPAGAVRGDRNPTPFMGRLDSER